MTNLLVDPIRSFAIVVACLVGTALTMDALAKDPSPPSEASATDETVPEEPHKLSTAPQEYPIYPDDRPMWVDQPDNISTDWAELVVLSVPSLSLNNSSESLEEQQQIALAAYANQYIGAPGADELLTFPEETIEGELVDPKRTYHGKITTSTGEMYQHASVLVLDGDFHAEMLEQWKSLEVAERLKAIGVIGALAFAGLVGTTGLLRSISPRRRSDQDDPGVVV